MPVTCRLCSEHNTKLFLRERTNRSKRDFIHCARCDCIFVPDEFLISTHEEKERYLLHENTPQNKGYREFLGILANQILPVIPPGAEGLDYGCGHPAVLSMILEESGCRMTGYDLFFKCDPASLQRTYDFIVCSETVEHFRKPLLEFERFDMLLRPGGIIGIMTGMPDEWSNFANWHYRLDPTHICFYSKATIRYLAQRFRWTYAFPRENVVILTKPGVKK